MGWVNVLAVETGMRRGEIVGPLTDTKNGHGRFLPLSDRAVEALEHGDKQHEYVFPMTANAVRLAWERLKKKNNIEGFQFYDLRHEAISRMFNEGMTIP